MEIVVVEALAAIGTMLNVLLNVLARNSTNIIPVVVVFKLMFSPPFSAFCPNISSQVAFKI